MKFCISYRIFTPKIITNNLSHVLTSWLYMKKVCDMYTLGVPAYTKRTVCCNTPCIYVQNFQSYLFGNLISTQSSPVLVWLYFWYRSPLSVYEILEYNIIVNCLPFMVDFCNIEHTNLQACCILQPHKYSYVTRHRYIWVPMRF